MAFSFSECFIQTSSPAQGPADHNTPQTEQLQVMLKN